MAEQWVVDHVSKISSPRALVLALALTMTIPALAQGAGDASPTWRVDQPLVLGQDDLRRVVLAGDGAYAVISGSGVRGNDRPHFFGLIDAQTGAAVWKVTTATSEREQRVATSDDARVIAVPDMGGRDRLSVWLDRAPGVAWTYQLPAFRDPVEVSVTPDGSRVAVAAQDGTGGPVEVTVLDRSGAVGWTARLETAGFPSSLLGILLSVKVVAHGERVLVVFTDVAYVLSKDGSIAASIPHLACCGDVSVDVSEDGTLLAVGDANTLGGLDVLQWHPILKRYVPAWHASSGRNSVRELAFSRDGSTLAVGSNDRNGTFFVDFSRGVVHVYDAQRGTLRGTFADHGAQARIDAVSVNGDGTRVVVGALGSLDGDEHDVLTVLDGSARPLVSLDRTDALGSITQAGISRDGATIVALGSTGHPVTGVADRVLLGLHVAAP